MVHAWQEAFLWFIGLVMALSAVRVVTTRNVVHAALWLVATLLGAAAVYILLLAEFVAWAQVLVYVGAIVVLMLFGLMLTRAPIGSRDYDNDQRLLAAVVATALFLVISWIMYDAFEDEKVNLVRDTGTTSGDIGAVIFDSYVLPFEAVSVLLLAALIGAVLIARKDDAPAQDRDRQVQHPAERS